jgi:hypothetical protein
VRGLAAAAARLACCARCALLLRRRQMATAAHSQQPTIAFLSLNRPKRCQVTLRAATGQHTVGGGAANTMQQRPTRSHCLRRNRSRRKPCLNHIPQHTKPHPPTNTKRHQGYVVCDPGVTVSPKSTAGVAYAVKKYIAEAATAGLALKIRASRHKFHSTTTLACPDQEAPLIGNGTGGVKHGGVLAVAILHDNMDKVWGGVGGGGGGGMRHISCAAGPDWHAAERGQCCTPDMTPPSITALLSY